MKARISLHLESLCVGEMLQILRRPPLVKTFANTQHKHHRAKSRDTHKTWCHCLNRPAKCTHLSTPHGIHLRSPTPTQENFSLEPFSPCWVHDMYSSPAITLKRGEKPPGWSLVHPFWTRKTLPVRKQCRRLQPAALPKQACLTGRPPCPYCTQDT